MVLIIRAAQWIWNQLIDCFITSPLISHLNWSFIRNILSIFGARIGRPTSHIVYFHSQKQQMDLLDE
jgi:hypothetical protein